MVLHILAWIGGLGLLALVVFGILCWLASGLKPGDLP